MDKEVLRQALVLGFSTRYNSRSGMGRFGVGATLAGMSQAKRLKCTADAPGGDSLYSYLDLAEIANKEQTYMPEPAPAKVPPQFADMAPTGTGTLVVWSNCDRLTQGDDGTVNDLKTVKEELLNFLSRTYRYFIDGGVKIQVNDVAIEAHHDPLYLMTIPRFASDEEGGTHCWMIPSTGTSLLTQPGIRP